MENLPPATPVSPSPIPSAAKPYPGAESTKRGNGRGWILALAILQFCGGLFNYGLTKSTHDDAPAGFVLATMLGLSAIFFALWIWGKKAPFAALLTALIIFVTVHLLAAVFEPLSLFKGIILKLAFLVGLSTALKTAYTRKREAELEAAHL